VTALSERGAAPAGRLPSAVRARVGAYVALTKPRIIELLLVTTVPAMMLAAGGWPTWELLLSTLVGGTLAAGAANVFNCYYDRDIDRLMHRTQRRPLVTGQVSPRGALVFGVVLTVVSIAVLWATTTTLAALLAAGAIFYYAVLYTVVLKRHTRHSTLFGGVPGAAPVLIGWAAVTGSLDWPAVVVFGVVFCWQLPHFWALAGDYGIGWIYTASAAGLGLWFVVEAHRLLRRIRRDVEMKPMQLFHVSISYLALLSVAIVVDSLI
jgi:protoheme IX farnesyltransferase